MKNKNRNSLMYISTVIVVIIVYIVIYLFGVSLRKNILDENGGYQNNPAPQPTNSIISSLIDSKVIFEYEYEDGNYIYLDNQFPTSDSDGKNFIGDKYTQDFKLRFNELALGVRYTITAERLNESDLDNTWVKTYLTSDGVGIDNCFRKDGKVKTMDEYDNYKNNPNEKVLYQGRVTFNEARRGYKNFTFRMWISDDVKVVNEEYPSKTIKVKINVYAQREI